MAADENTADGGARQPPVRARVWWYKSVSSGQAGRQAGVLWGVRAGRAQPATAPACLRSSCGRHDYKSLGASHHPPMCRCLLRAAGAARNARRRRRGLPAPSLTEAQAHSHPSTGTARAQRMRRANTGTEKGLFWFSRTRPMLKGPRAVPMGAATPASSTLRYVRAGACHFPPLQNAQQGRRVG